VRVHGLNTSRSEAPRKVLLSMAYGSLMELETQIESCRRVGFLAGEDVEALLARCSEVARLLNGLHGSLE
jgi:four helix bundle protein